MAQPTHRHDLAHRGLVPVPQLASGSPIAGQVPVYSGGATAVWGGGSAGTAILACSTIDQVLELLGLVPPVFDPGDLCMLFPEE
jgi:hypothetical protein